MWDVAKSFTSDGGTTEPPLATGMIISQYNVLKLMYQVLNMSLNHCSLYTLSNSCNPFYFNTEPEAGLIYFTNTRIANNSLAVSVLIKQLSIFLNPPWLQV